MTKKAYAPNVARSNFFFGFKNSGIVSTSQDLVRDVVKETEGVTLLAPQGGTSTINRVLPQVPKRKKLTKKERLALLNPNDSGLSEGPVSSSNSETKVRKSRKNVKKKKLDENIPNKEISLVIKNHFWGILN